MAVQDWNTNDTLNTTLEGVDVSEGCLPSGLNDMFRKIAAAVRVFYDKSYRKGENFTIQPTGSAAPASPAENDLWGEY